jgi:hypothetical protein
VAAGLAGGVIRIAAEVVSLVRPAAAR